MIHYEKFIDESLLKNSSHHHLLRQVTGYHSKYLNVTVTTKSPAGIKKQAAFVRRTPGEIVHPNNEMEASIYNLKKLLKFRNNLIRVLYKLAANKYENSIYESMIFIQERIHPEERDRDSVRRMLKNLEARKLREKKFNENYEIVDLTDNNEEQCRKVHKIVDSTDTYYQAEIRVVTKPVADIVCLD